MQRGRRLRRALALSRNEPYQLILPPLENPGAMRVALSEIVQALAVGQIDHRSAGLMLYAIQQATTVTLRIEQIQVAQQNATEEANAGEIARLEDYPEFERNLDLEPGIDLDAETDRVMRRAEEQAAALSIAPNPLPGSDCPVPAKIQYTREEAYQCLQWEIHFMRKQIREFQEERKRESNKIQAASAIPPLAEPVSSSA
jgi:hypothetical protein